MVTRHLPQGNLLTKACRMPTLAPVLSLRQSSLPGFCRVTEAVATLSKAGIEERGSIVTRREVVDFILDPPGFKIFITASAGHIASEAARKDHVNG